MVGEGEDEDVDEGEDEDEGAVDDEGAGEDVVLCVPLVKLYTLRRLGPPQNSELFPLQVMEQSPGGVGAPPLENELAQSLRSKVS